MNAPGRVWVGLAGLLILLPLSGLAATPPDLTGTYDVGTLTRLERPEAFGDALYLSPEEAEQMRARWEAALTRDTEQVDPNADRAPDRHGYSLGWMDRGSSAAMVDGRFRTSIITSPANGQIPPMTPQGLARIQTFDDEQRIVWRDPVRERDPARAWWLEDGDPAGPFDHIEQRSNSERCIIGSRSTAGPPMLPNAYNNHKRIVQTDSHVMILTEMNHDARIIRINASHRPASVRSWLGDSVGRWEGDTLVVETRSFLETPALKGADRNLQVTERFTPQADGSLLYGFTVRNPEVWVSDWGGEYPWRPSDAKVYEYACHEGNYALRNILSGARRREAEFRARQTSAGGT